MVAASSGVIAATEGVPEAMISLSVGLLGVTLARWVFVNREHRSLPKPQRWNETLPLTLVAMLITGALIWDKNYSISMSAFIGLGVGWSAVVLLDVLGDWVIVRAKSIFSAGPAHDNFPKVADLSGHDGKVLTRDVELPEAIAETFEKAAKALNASEEKFDRSDAKYAESGKLRRRSNALRKESDDRYEESDKLRRSSDAERRGEPDPNAPQPDPNATRRGDPDAKRRQDRDPDASGPNY